MRLVGNDDGDGEVLVMILVFNEYFFLCTYRESIRTTEYDELIKKGN